MGFVACRHIGPVGTPESVWTPALGNVRRVEPDQILRPADALVVIAPHPDDEVLTCGGLMAEHVARGGRLRIIAVSDGEASHADRDAAAAQLLAERRRRESDEGLRRLGAVNVDAVRLRFPDGAVAGCLEPLRETLSRLVVKGDVVVTTWQLDGHPDHEAVGTAVEAVCDEVGALCLQAPVWMWH